MNLEEIHGMNSKRIFLVEGDGPCFSVPRNGQGVGKTIPDFDEAEFSKNSTVPIQGQSSSHPGVLDFFNPNEKVFKAPEYFLATLPENHKYPNVAQLYEAAMNEKFKPVNVVYARDWNVEGVGKPKLYKMDSNPRGCALIVNNTKFNNTDEYPERFGSDNDEWRLKNLLEKFHFDVEIHQNKTKEEMEEIVNKFSQKPELKNVDCLWVTFMSHGKEGTTVWNSEVIGVDGIGYKTKDIVSAFTNDRCQALLGKPKIFPFQACRGDQCDPGVWGNTGRYEEHDDISRRTETDGRRVSTPKATINIRTQEDIFVAYPTPGGISANRDVITGGWFMQAIIDVFSEYACDSHLDDLMKLVDCKIKKKNKSYNQNLQSVTTSTCGWNKNLYFNPGLWKDYAGNTIRMEDSQPEEQAL